MKFSDAIRLRKTMLVPTRDALVNLKKSAAHAREAGLNNIASSLDAATLQLEKRMYVDNQNTIFARKIRTVCKPQ